PSQDRAGDEVPPIVFAQPEPVPRHATRQVAARRVEQTALFVAQHFLPRLSHFSSPSESKLAATGPQPQPGSWARCNRCAGTPPGTTPAAPGISPHRGAVSPPAPVREGGSGRSYGLLATHRSNASSFEFFASVHSDCPPVNRQQCSSSSSRISPVGPLRCNARSSRNPFIAPLS